MGSVAQLSVRLKQVWDDKPVYHASEIELLPPDAIYLSPASTGVAILVALRSAGFPAHGPNAATFLLGVIASGERVARSQEDYRLTDPLLSAHRRRHRDRAVSRV
jgi:hypothetical protein